MAQDYLCLNEYICVELLFEDLLVKIDFLRCIELLEVILGFEDEWQSLKHVLEVYHHTNLLRLQVQNTITEVHKYQTFVLWILRVAILFPVEELALTM